MTIEVEVLDVAFSILVQLCVAHGNLSCQEADILSRILAFSVVESCTSSPICCICK